MLQASDIFKRYGANPVLDAVSFVLNDGERLALVGPNGCGKTTLLRIMAGLEPADRGSVRRSPADLRLGYLEQGLTFVPNETVAAILGVHVPGLVEAEQRVAALAAELGVSSDAEGAAAYDRALAELQALAGQHPLRLVLGDLLPGQGLAGVVLDRPVGTLSGGQKTRLGLARLLLARPQVLLLDEPTNHLDLDALEWLERWLSGYPGGVLLVSHDRALLDRLATGILDLDPATHTVQAYAGGYSDYASVQAREREKQWATYTDQQEHIARVENDIRRLSGRATGIERETTHYHYRKVAKGVARRAVVQRRRLERELEGERIEKPGRTWQMAPDLGQAPGSGRDVLALEGLAVGYGGQAVVSGVSQVLRLGERVALAGPNGCGKTTLLRTIAGVIAPLAGRVRLGAGVQHGYYAQEQEVLDPAGTPLQAIIAVAPMPQTEARAFLHRYLFAGDEVFATIAHLSYGQRARLALAGLVAAGCNLLLLDEPVNHLDIPSRTAFEEALRRFPGTVLAAVHDRYFIRQLRGQVWAVEDGRVVAYVDAEAWEGARSGSPMEAGEA